MLFYKRKNKIIVHNFWIVVTNKTDKDVFIFYDLEQMIEELTFQGININECNISKMSFIES